MIPLKQLRYAGLALVLILYFSFSPVSGKSKFSADVKPLPEWVVAKMKRHSWRKGCPVPLKDLSYIYLSYRDNEGAMRMGRLVVHKKVTKDVVEIFKILFDAGFPIEKMNLIEDYQGSDDASMADNNTSAFNCREVTGRPGIFSKHSFGLAIDINPLVNPYLYDNKIVPPGGKAYVDRTLNVRGMIKKGDVVHKAFLDRGWIWGGTWRTVKDYQHFQKNIAVK